MRESDLGGELVLFWPGKKIRCDGQNAGYEGVLQEVAPFSRLLCPSHYHEQFQTTGRQLMIWVILTVMEKVTKSIFKQCKPCVFGSKCCLVLGAT